MPITNVCATPQVCFYQEQKQQLEFFFREPPPVGACVFPPQPPGVGPSNNSPWRLCEYWTRQKY